MENKSIMFPCVLGNSETDLQPIMKIIDDSCWYESKRYSESFIHFYGKEEGTKRFKDKCLKVRLQNMADYEYED